MEKLRALVCAALSKQKSLSTARLETSGTKRNQSSLLERFRWGLFDVDGVQYEGGWYVVMAYVVMAYVVMASLTSAACSTRAAGNGMYYAIAPNSLPIH